MTHSEAQDLLMRLQGDEFRFNDELAPSLTLTGYYTDHNGLDRCLFFSGNPPRYPGWERIWIGTAADSLRRGILIHIPSDGPGGVL